jgi:SAM-dependent methyltransferase
MRLRLSQKSENVVKEKLMFTDRNFRAYESAEAISAFSSYSFLFPAEEYLFDKYVLEGTSVLDLGVGAGRTTPALAIKAKRYVGLDYVQGMIDVCISKFPNFEFICADAAELSVFDDASFDIVIFSFNGLDVFPTLERRSECLREIRRVLSAKGLFIFSSHNARMLAHAASFKIGPLIRSLKSTWRYSKELIRSGAFFRGAGYYRDASHGDTEFFSSTPRFISRELCFAGFEVIEMTHDHRPREVPTFLIPWRYYVARRL